MNDQPGVANLRTAPARNRELGRADQGHEKDQWKQANAEYGHMVVRVRDQKQERDEKSTNRGRLVEVIQRQMACGLPEFDKRYQVKHRSDAESRQSRLKQARAFPEKIDEGVQQTARVQGGGRPQPENTHSGTRYQYKVSARYPGFS